MSKVLVLSNGVSMEFTDNSTIENLVTVVESFAEIDAMRANLTEENFNNSSFDGEAVVNLVPVSTDVSAGAGEDNITVTFVNRFKTDVELLRETQTQQDDVINYLLMK